MTERNFYLLTIWNMEVDNLLKWREHPDFKEMVVQEEVTSTGKPHYQGAISLNKRVTHSSIKKFAQQIMPKMASVNCKEDNDKELSTYKRCVNYCSGNSGAGLMKCANLNNRFIITKGEIRTIQTSDEGLRQWHKHHKVKIPLKENFKTENEYIMQCLKNNIKECQKYILDWN